MRYFIPKKNVFILLMMLPCLTYSQSIKKSKQTVLNQYIKTNIKIGHFTTIPNEIDGGSCGFYLSIQDKKKGIYVCVNDMANIAYLVINNKMERFTLVDVEKNSIFNYKSKQHLLKIIIFKKKDTGYESYATEGRMIVSTPDGQKKEFAFIGDCGL